MSNKTTCRHCKTEFIPLKGAKGLFCSYDCHKQNTRDRIDPCVACHCFIGLTGAASGRLLKTNRGVISKSRRRQGLKTLTPSEAQTIKHAWKTEVRGDLRMTWDNWWGDKETSLLWAQQFKCPLPDWSKHSELNNWKFLKNYYGLTKEQRKQRNKAKAERTKKRIQADPEYAKKYKEMQRRWRAKNRQANSRYAREYRKKNPDKYRRSSMSPQQRSRDNMRNRFKELMKTTQNGGAKSFSKTIGCTTAQLAKHLESQWEPWMNWDNYGTGDGRRWHVDHVIPCAAFDHTDPHQVKTCWHFSNLRPLCSKENIAKSDTFGWDEVSHVIYMLNKKSNLLVA